MSRTRTAPHTAVATQPNPAQGNYLLDLAIKLTSALVAIGTIVTFAVIATNRSHSTHGVGSMPRLYGAMRQEFRPPSRHEGEINEDEESSATADTYSTNYMYNQKNGAVQTDPRVYLIFWGDWSGDRLGVMNRLYYFYKGIGGSAWGKVMTQYRQGCTPGTWNCTGAAAGNPAAPFKAWYKDTSYIPATPTQNDVAAEARKYAKIVGDYSLNAQYVVALPPGHGDDDFVAKGGDACAWHYYTWVNSSSWVTYTALPYQPDSTRCYSNWVNSGTAGLLDGVTMVAGHEYAESITDPGINAWYDAVSASGAQWENGDKCSKWGRNVTFSTGTFPVEPTWSNYARYYNGSGCVYS